MRSLILLMIWIGSVFHLSAQDNNKKDSLLRLLNTAKEDTTKIMLLIRVQKLYSTDNFDSSFYYLNKAKDLSAKLRTTAYDQFINTAFSEYYYHNNDYKQAINYALANKELAEKTSDQKLLAKTYNNLAAIYNHSGQFKSGIEYALKCLDLSEKTKDSASFPIRNLTASNSYYNLKQYDKAIYYANRAVNYGERFQNKFAVMMGLNNLGAFYSDINKKDSAIIFFKQVLQMGKEEEDIVNIISALLNLCSNSFEIGNAAELKKYAAELKTYAPQMPDEKLIAEIHNSFALNFIMQKKYDLAKDQLDTGIALALKDSNTDALGNLYQGYSKLYYLQDKIAQAEIYNFKYDSITSAVNLKELNFYTEELETKYETQKKESLIKLQQADINRKGIFNYILLGSAVAILAISLLGYRSYRNRQKFQQAKIDELETEKQLTATEAVLKGEEQERIRLAKDLHDGLGGMLSGIKYSLSNMKGNLIMTPENAQAFERSIDMLDSSIKEMRRVAHNMMPEILVKYGLDIALKEFSNEIGRSGVININYHSIGMEKEAIEQIAAVTIYRIVQELVNNSIKHSAAKNVLVQAHASEEEKLLTITVEDDGKGFDKNLLTASKGMGWSNIQNRVDFLKGKIDISSGQGKGTSVLIEINI